MNDGMIHIPAKRREEVSQQQVIRVSPEAYNTLVEIYNESALSLKEIASRDVYKRQHLFRWLV